MATYDQAVVSTGNRNTTETIPEVRSKLYRLEPEAHPFVSVLTMAKKRVRKLTTDVEFKTLEQRPEGRQTQINNGSGYTTTSTSIVVDDGGIFEIFDTIYVNSTGEVMLVTAKSTNTLTVTRALAGTRTAMVDNDYLTRMATAYAQGAAKQTPNVRRSETVTNYPQIIRTPFGVTGTQRALRTYTGNPLTDMRINKAIEHNKSKEHAFLFGKKAQGSGNTPRYLTQGLIPTISTNTYAAPGGVLTEAAFEENLLEGVFRYGGSTKLFYCSARICSVLDGWARSRARLKEAEQESASLGFKVQKFISSHGTLLVKKHYLLEGDTWSGYGIIVDPEYVSYAMVPGRDMWHRKDIQAPGDDTKEEEYLSECGLDIILEETHGLLTGVTS